MLNVTNSLLLMTALFNIGLAVIILRQNWRNLTNLYFGVFLCALAVWALVLIGTQIGPSYEFWLYSTKAAYISALVIGIGFYLFSISFPEGVRPPAKTLLWTCGLSLLFTAALLIEPSFLTKEITTYSWGNGIRLGLPEYLMFTVLFCFLYVGGLIRTWIKYFRSEAGLSKIQLLIIALSVTVTGIGGMYYNLVLPSPFFDNSRYIWTGPLFTTSIAVMIMYSIFRLKLFNAKVIVTELLIALLWIFTFLRTLLASNSMEQLWNGGLFVLALTIGFLLVKSVRAEVDSREKIEKLAGDLKIANQRQEGLIHFVSHEVKGALGKCAGLLSLIKEGDFGQVSPELAVVTERGLTDTRTAVDMVSTILLSSNLKSGVMKFDMQSLNFLDDVVRPAVDALRIDAERKGLQMFFKEEVSVPCVVVGDKEMLSQHVVRNLIDNAIRYTPVGSIIVSVRCISEKMVLSVTDSGVGISEDDMAQLFTEGGRGKDSVKVNVNSTGYGLFFAKQLVDAHGGSIRAESAGSGKGSTFVVEIPLAKN